MMKNINLARNPFASQLDIAKIADDLQDKLLEMGNDSSAHDLFLEKPLLHFGFSAMVIYKDQWLHLKSLSFLSPLTYLKVDFLHLFKSRQKQETKLMCKNIKTEARNKLYCSGFLLCFWFENC